MKSCKKIATILIVLAMLLSLNACGGETASDPNLGKYPGDQIDILGWMPLSEVYSEGENYIELNANGKANFCLDGETIKCKWTLEGQNLSLTAEGQECTAILADGVITITDFFGTSIGMTFVKDGAQAPSLVTDGTSDGAEVPEAGAENSDSNVSEDPMTETADYGKTTADATGIVDLETLQSGFEWLRGQTSQEGGYQKPTYEEVREHFGGIDGKQNMTDSWEDGYHGYLWATEDNSSHILISFKLQDDGSEIWNSSNWQGDFPE